MRSVLLSAAICVSAATAHANAIQTACLNSARSAPNRAVCACIQDAANMTLTARDQKLAASFFADPHKAQEIRQSDRRSHENFWKRYRAFGETAEAVCVS